MHGKFFRKVIETKKLTGSSSPGRRRRTVFVFSSLEKMNTLLECWFVFSKEEKTASSSPPWRRRRTGHPNRLTTYIKTVNGHQAVTFREAAENLGILSGDHIVMMKCLDEAVSYQTSRKWIALATASSGIAASILPGGRIAHSTFKIPIDGDNKYVCNI
nr:ATP-dependent DNA helicase PIF4-like [Ipomoea batatas]